MTDIKESMLSRSGKIISKLKSMSSIRAGDRWNTYEESPQKPSIRTKISRTIWYSGEERRINLADINSTIETSFNVLDDIYGHLAQHPNMSEIDIVKYKDIIRNIKLNILSARDGILNLKVAYHDDGSTCYQIDLTITSIKDKYQSLLDRYVDVDGNDIIQYRTPPRPENPDD